MIKGDFEIIICSPSDKEKLVCEIYYQGAILAEISQETPELIIEIYPPSVEQSWSIPFEMFRKILADAKKYLLSGEVTSDIDS